MLFCNESLDLIIANHDEAYIFDIGGSLKKNVLVLSQSTFKASITFFEFYLSAILKYAINIPIKY